MSYRVELLEEHELGWRAAGAIGRENEGPGWMRKHILYMRFGCPNESQESAAALRDRPSHVMM